MPRTRPGRLIVLVAALGALAGCSNQPPRFQELADPQLAYVETEFTMELRAVDADGDSVDFSFTADIADVHNRATLEPTGPDTAIFHYTPIISDLGSHSFDFFASDGSSTSNQTIVIDIRRPPTGSGAPIFRQPLGTGTTLDLAQKSCGGLTIVIEDPDDSQVVIEQQEPRIAGATLSQDGPLTAAWSWCPSDEQIAGDDRYMLKLAASDDDGNTTTKDYLIVLRKPGKPDCPGAAPTITNQSDSPQVTLLPVLVVAQVADDLGIKNEPLIYYSFTQPQNPPDLAAMTQLSMMLLEGDDTSGSWGVEIPNPVADQPAGATATMYYVLVAQDNDDEAGDCDHLTQAPATGTFTLQVQNPGGQGGLGLCEPCTHDVQCGGPNDNCLIMGSTGGSFCFKICTQDAECPPDATGRQYYCSVTDFTSVDGVTARQCVPNTYSCAGAACVNDDHEPNDTQAAVASAAALPPGTYANLKMCPPAGGGKDEDWYPIDISADAEITASIDGGPSSDLDLAVVDAAGTVVVKSQGLTSQETVTTCLTPGKYDFRVYTWSDAENGYSLTWSKTTRTCQVVCTDDAAENDDNETQARTVNLAGGRYVSDTNAICANDEDWFKVSLTQGATLYATVAFTQTTPSEDLDIRFYQQGTPVVDLTNCTETDVSGCSASNGQSANSSNENFTWPVTATGTYYVVVHGWMGSQNLYDICIALSNASGTGCPPLPKP
jgi:hypothetical protein